MKTLLEQAKILIVDDEPTLRLGFSFALKAKGYQVETAADGDYALEKATVFKPDLILLDLRMPGRDGLGFLREWRPEAPHIPVILASAHASSASALEAIRLNVFDFLSKPVKPHVLREQVKRCLMRSQWDVERTSDEGDNGLSGAEKMKALMLAGKPETAAAWIASRVSSGSREATLWHQALIAAGVAEGEPLPDQQSVDYFQELAMLQEDRN